MNIVTQKEEETARKNTIIHYENEIKKLETLLEELNNNYQSQLEEKEQDFRAER